MNSNRGIWMGFALMVAAWSAMAQAPPISAEPNLVEVEAKVTAVTVYRGRALVTRTATLSLEPGLYDLRLTGLPESLQPQTLQARLRGGAKVLNVEYAAEQSADPNHLFAELDATIEHLQRQMKELVDRRELISVQERFIDSLSAKAAAEAGQDAGTARFDLNAMRDQLTFIAEERGKLMSARQDLENNYRTLEKQLLAAQARRNAVSGRGDTVRSAVVSIVATEPASTTLDVSYLVNDASWEPAYNVRASIAGATSQIEYEAILVQRTGEDWDDVKLTLSTAQPMVAANPPALRPWFVDIFRPETYRKSMPASIAPAAPPDSSRLGYTPEELDQLSSDATVAGEGPSVAFELPRPVTVKTNIQQQQRTRIATIESKARFIHVAVPLHTEAVYVRGDIANISAYQLLPGRANVFLGQDYVGPTTLAAVAPNGEFKLHFGIDPAIKATRQLLTKKTENTGLLSGGRRTSYDYRLVIDNGSGKPIAMELWDRYPISRTSEVQIEVVEMSHPLATDTNYASEEQPQGLLKWMLAVPAAATGKSALVVSYGVRINRAKDVEITPLPE